MLYFAWNAPRFPTKPFCRTRPSVPHQSLVLAASMPEILIFAQLNLKASPIAAEVERNKAASQVLSSASLANVWGFLAYNEPPWRDKTPKRAMTLVLLPGNLHVSSDESARSHTLTSKSTPFFYPKSGENRKHINLPSFDSSDSELMVSVWATAAQITADVLSAQATSHKKSMKKKKLGWKEESSASLANDRQALWAGRTAP